MLANMSHSHWDCVSGFVELSNTFLGFQLRVDMQLAYY